MEFPFFEYPTGGLEFSPNGKYIYYDDLNYLIQIEISRNDNLIPDTIAHYDGYFAAVHTNFYQQEFAPDGKIYMCAPNGVLEMHRINNPNGKLENCAFVQRDIKLPTANGFTMPHYPNYRLYDDPGCPCDTLGIDGPVFIEGHPYDLQACIGVTNFLEVTALGTYLAYQWQMEQNGNWVDLANDTVFSGVDTALLYFNLQDASLSSKNFRCVVWNHLNADTSRVAQITVIENKPIANFATSQVGNEVQFTNLTTGAIQRSYWQFGDEWIEEQSGIPTNSSHNRLKDPLHMYRSPGWYHPQLVVENGCGRDTVQKDLEVQFSDFYANFTTTETNLCGVEYDGTRFINKSTFNATYFKYLLPGGNHTIAEVPDANIYYNTPGVYDVTFIVSDGTQWDTVYRPNYIKVYDDPTAEIAYSIDGHQVTFSTPDFAQYYSWQFGDGIILFKS